uniref:Uncharacterized protein n=1 Tax=Kalanchoe fedtschenkoi TaxID=63787 RepID=A0A7N0VK61_KALFE
MGSALKGFGHMAYLWEGRGRRWRWRLRLRPAPSGGGGGLAAGGGVGGVGLAAGRRGVAVGLGRRVSGVEELQGGLAVGDGVGRMELAAGCGAGGLRWLCGLGWLVVGQWLCEEGLPNPPPPLVAEIGFRFLERSHLVAATHLDWRMLRNLDTDWLSPFSVFLSTEGFKKLKYLPWTFMLFSCHLKSIMNFNSFMEDPVDMFLQPFRHPI